jgi:hypothetical protein
MRLGQLARIYDVSAKKIISYLEEAGSAQDTLHHNSKLNEQTKAMLAKHFNYVEQLSEEASEGVEQKLTEPEVVELEQSIEATQSELDHPLPEAKPKDLQKQDEEVVEEVAIESDKLLELLESEETAIDLSKITLIKAPKKELSGLKVVGKIELPEPKNKTVKKSELRTGHQRRQLSEEELEKRRLKAKKRKEEYQVRQEKRRKEKEKKQRKALNEARYQQKLQRTKYNQLKHKDKTQGPQSSLEVKEPTPEPKTLLGRFWRWMNT